MLERLKAGGEGRGRIRVGWMPSQTWWSRVWSKPWELVDRAQNAAFHRVAKIWTPLSYWTTNILEKVFKYLVKANLWVEHLLEWETLKVFLYLVLEYSLLRSGTLLKYLSYWLHKLQLLVFFWESFAHHEKCLSVIKEHFSWIRFLFLEVIDIMIPCHSVLSVDILLELTSRNSEMLTAVCICLFVHCLWPIFSFLQSYE